MQVYVNVTVIVCLCERLSVSVLVSTHAARMGETDNL